MKLITIKKIAAILILLSTIFLILIAYKSDIKKIPNINFSFIQNIIDTKKENDILKKQNIEYTNKTKKINSIKNQVASLNDIEQFKNKNPDYQFITCNIARINKKDVTNTYIIDKGLKNSLSKGMIVITPKGLFGKITSVTKNYSVVESIESTNLIFSAIIQNDKENSGTVNGNSNSYDNKNILQMSVPNTIQDIKSGYIVSTWNIGNFTPRGIKIGYVLNEENDVGTLSKIITVQPYLNFNNIDLVLVVVPQDKQNVKYTIGDIKY